MYICAYNLHNSPHRKEPQQTAISDLIILKHNCITIIWNHIR